MAPRGVLTPAKIPRESAFLGPGGRCIAPQDQVLKAKNLV